MYRLVSIYVVLFLLIAATHLKAQIVINEMMASNTDVINDPDHEESADWIELYNTGNQTVSLKGHYLTDNISAPTKWKIETDVEIGPGEYLLIWADGMNANLHTSFKLSALGEELALISPTYAIIDSISFGPQVPNISFGRRKNGGNDWGYFEHPTPGEANSTISYSAIVKSVPNFSLNGGIYHMPQNIELKTLFGGDVRFTLDGSEPTPQSAVAHSPIPISKTTIVRARIYKPDQILGPIATHTYFIDQNQEMGNLPVISISSDPENFWDSEKGIYVQDFKPEWEVPVNIELFENDGSDRAAFNLPAGIKINGLYSWQLPQKMLGVYFRKKYGAGKLEYPLIFEKERKHFDSFALRASGSDWAYTLFRDGMVQNATLLNTHLDNSGFRASVVYINGQYMGIHNIREKIDEDFVVQNHRQEPGTVDIIENENYAEAGNIDAYNDLLNLIAKDLTIQENWDAVANAMHIDNFTDLIATEIFDGNTSISHNVMCWKPKNDGKWNWIIMDLDRGFFNVQKNLIDFYVKQNPWPFKDLIKNNEYKKYFGRRLADHLFTTFNPLRMKKLIDDHQSLIDDEIPQHVERWKGTSSSYGDPISSYNNWLNEVNRLRSYADARPQIIINDLINYGFEPSLALSVSTLPEQAGSITFNGMIIPVPNCVGAYPANEQIKLVADAKTGYRFLGWSSNKMAVIIPRESVWKYFDKGSNPGTSWQSISFNDSDWSSGKAELGYGDGDEQTVIAYGSDSRKKHITTYFRKNFTIDHKENIQHINFSLKCDDGAVVYLNGHEIGRYNLTSGTINDQTNANSPIGGSAESLFTSYSANADLIVNGLNMIAVEVHQSSGNSSDLSFDLELTANMINDGNFISTQNELVLTMDGEKSINAVFESTGQCILPDEITDIVILNKACSPYIVSGNVTISTSGKLIAEAGVEVLMADGASIFARGPIMISGTKNEPVIFRSNPNSNKKAWGTISFNHVQDTSVFSNLIIEDASHGPHPVNETAAISLFRSNIKLDNITIEKVHENPIVARYSNISLTNSSLHSAITGDLINVKYGKAYIANCTFRGNDQPDTDAIDYDDVADGVIKHCQIHDFHGINSDAIDIGEKAQNIRIDSIFVYNITDKGVSVGQQSRVHISNSIFANCNLGVGIKDSSHVTINQCTYFGTNIAVALFEKNPGDAGGNSKVTNTILSNSYESTFSCDTYSNLDISYSLSDNNPLPDTKNNIFANPNFINPTLFNLNLANGSPAIGAGSNGNIGAGITFNRLSPNLIISDIAYLTQAGVDLPEFVAIYNADEKSVDISGYRFTRGFTYTFPHGTSIAPKEKIYVTSNQQSPFWINRVSRLHQWESGKLADEGETIQLETDNGIIMDGVKYNNKAPWPKFDNAYMAITVSSFDVDNHFGENWVLKPIDELVSSYQVQEQLNAFKIYPNPTSGNIFITGTALTGKVVNVYNLMGIKIESILMKSDQSAIDLTTKKPGVYIIQCERFTQRLLLK